jgi:hypothetical protein
MLKTTFAVAALATALSLGATADKAAAMSSATPTQLGLDTADSGLIQKAAVVCGRWGCRRVVRGSRVWVGPRRPLYGFARPGWGWSGPGWGGTGFGVSIGVGPSWGWGWGRPGWGW